MNSLLLILSIFEVVVGIWSAFLGCRSVCCGRRSQSGVVRSHFLVITVHTTALGTKYSGGSDHSTGSKNGTSNF